MPEQLSQFSLTVALATLTISLGLYVLNIAGIRLAPALMRLSVPVSPQLVASGSLTTAERYATLLATNSFLFLSAALVARAVASHHAPFASMFEFSLAFSWGAVALFLCFAWRYQARILALFVLPVALGLLVYASTLPGDLKPLVPALQNDLLLSVHVACAVIAYGAFTVAFAAGVLCLLQYRDNVNWLPPHLKLDDIGYRAVMVGFPVLALTILLGSVWAETAWGTYWSWDPKETASLATWLIYGGYLHARVMRGWRGQRSALLLIGGFAATLFTYYGNLFFGGMHGYA